MSVDGNARTTSQKHHAVYICTKVGGGREHGLGNLLGDLCRGGGVFQPEVSGEGDELQLIDSAHRS